MSEEGAGSYPIAVLIESDWNLKVTSKCRMTLDAGALIESDWNLKWEDTKLKTSAETVLIESYWNLRII